MRAAGHVQDAQDRSRFELHENGGLVFADYGRRGADLVIYHVEADPALRGTGAAGRLMEGVVAIAAAEKARLVPLCGYAAGWLRRHNAGR